jgi:hypothetical protein
MMATSGFDQLILRGNETIQSQLARQWSSAEFAAALSQRIAAAGLVASRRGPD